MCRTSIFEARNNFSNLVAMAEQGEPVELTRYNKPVAVIISYEDYENAWVSKPSLLDNLKKLKEEYSDVLNNEGIPLPPKEYPDPNRIVFEE